MEYYNFKLIRLEYNSWNGFVFGLLGLETYNHDRSILGIQFARRFLVIELFYVAFIIYDFTEN